MNSVTTLKTHCDRIVLFAMSQTAQSLFIFMLFLKVNSFIRCAKYMQIFLVQESKTIIELSVFPTFETL